MPPSRPAALLALAAAFAAAPSPAAQPLTVAARVLPVLHARTTSLPPAVSRDAVRGETVFAAATALDVRTNEGGFYVRIDVLDPAVERVRVEGLGIDLTAAAPGLRAWVPVRERAWKRFVLTYRILWPSAAPPSAGRLPVALAVENR